MSEIEFENILFDIERKVEEGEEWLVVVSGVFLVINLFVWIWLEYFVNINN